MEHYTDISYWDAQDLIIPTDIREEALSAISRSERVDYAVYKYDNGEKIYIVFFPDIERAIVAGYDYGYETLWLDAQSISEAVDAAYNHRNAE